MCLSLSLSTYVFINHTRISRNILLLAVVCGARTRSEDYSRCHIISNNNDGRPPRFIGIERQNTFREDILCNTFETLSRPSLVKAHFSNDAYILYT